MRKVDALDRLVGQIAGAIYMTIVDHSSHRDSPVVFVPALSFKIKKSLSDRGDLAKLSVEQKIELANDIELAVVPLLFSFDLEFGVIKKVTPQISALTYEALSKL